eukprot:385288-Pleurochrysis_carterae.AAC.3
MHSTSKIRGCIASAVWSRPVLRGSSASRHGTRRMVRRRAGWAVALTKRRRALWWLQRGERVYRDAPGDFLSEHDCTKTELTSTFDCLALRLLNTP